MIHSPDFRHNTNFRKKSKTVTFILFLNAALVQFQKNLRNRFREKIKCWFWAHKNFRQNMGFVTLCLLISLWLQPKNQKKISQSWQNDETDEQTDRAVFIETFSRAKNLITLKIAIETNIWLWNYVKKLELIPNQTAFRSNTLFFLISYLTAPRLTLGH